MLIYIYICSLEMINTSTRMLIYILVVGDEYFIIIYVMIVGVFESLIY